MRKDDILHRIKSAFEVIHLSFISGFAQRVDRQDASFPGLADKDRINLGIQFFHSSCQLTDRNDDRIRNRMIARS